MAGKGRMTEGEVGCVVSAEAATCDGNPVVAGLAYGAGQDLFHQEPVIQRMVVCPLGRRDRLVVPTVTVQAVGAIDLYLSVLQEPAGCFYQSLVFILIIRSF